MVLAYHLASAAVLLLIIVPTSPAVLDWPLEWLIVLVWMVLGCFLMLTQGKSKEVFLWIFMNTNSSAISISSGEHCWL